MLTINKILLPVVFTDNSAHFEQLACQAAWLARRFHAEIILLHVVTPFSYPYGLLESGHEITARDLHGKVVQCAQKALAKVLRPQLEGIAVTRVLLRGDPAKEIVEAARIPRRRPDHHVDARRGSSLPPSAGIGYGEGPA